MGREKKKEPGRPAGVKDGGTLFLSVRDKMHAVYIC